MKANIEFINPDDLPTPDVIVESGDEYRCQCGLFKSTAVVNGGITLNAPCPSCGAVVEVVARSVAKEEESDQ